MENVTREWLEEKVRQFTAFQLEISIEKIKDESKLFDLIEETSEKGKVPIVWLEMLEVEGKLEKLIGYDFYSATAEVNHKTTFRQYLDRIEEEVKKGLLAKKKRVKEEMTRKKIAVEALKFVSDEFAVDESEITGETKLLDLLKEDYSYHRKGKGAFYYSAIDAVLVKFEELFCFELEIGKDSVNLDTTFDQLVEVVNETIQKL